MKSTLQKLFSSMLSALSKPTLTAAENELGNNAGSFVREGNSSFSVALSVSRLYAIFGFIQKNETSVYNQPQQRNRFKVNTIGASALLLFFGMTVMNGQVLIPNTTAITQNFDSMGSSTTLPTNWRMHASTSSPTWSGAGTAVTQQASSGSPTAGGTYNFGSSTSERSIGAMSSGSFASPSNLLGFFQNSNAANLISLTVSYDAERYRINSAAASVQFFYSTNGSTWTAVTAGDVAASSFPTGSSAYNFTSGTVVSKTNISITGLNIPTGGAIYLRWNINTTGTNSQGIAIDDITVVAGFQATNPSITGAATATAFTTTYGTASTVQNFTVSGANLTANLVATAPTGFEVSSNGTTYGTTATFTQSGGTASGTLRVRLAATAPVGTYNSKTIALTSTGASQVNINTSSTGNTVTAKGLTITGISGVDRVYNRTNIATLSGTPAYAGLANGETFSVTGTPTALFGNKTVANNKPITITGYTAPSSNYTVTQPTGINADITAKDLTVANVTADDKVYDGTVTATLSATLNGVIALDNVTLSATGEFENNFQTIFFGTPANITNLSFSLSGGDSGNYNLVQPVVNDLTADIYPKELTITNAAAADKVYDGTINATVSGTLNGVVPGDVVTLVSSGTFASAAIGANIAVTPSWSIDGDTFNYTLTEPTVSLTANITSPGAPTVTSATTAAATYGAAATSYFITANMAVDSYDATGLPPGLTINPATGEITGSPTEAGVFTVTVSAINNGGTGFATLTYTISTVSLTLQNASAQNKPYDGTTNAVITGTLNGVIPGDAISFEGTGAFDTALVGTNIFVTPTITLTGAKAANYTLVQPSGLAASITAKPLTVTAAAADKVYAGNTATSAVVTVNSVDGVIGSESVTVTASGAFASGAAGDGKNVTVSYSLSGANASNYSVVSPVTLTANISKKPLTYTATADNKQYDGNTNATVTVSNINGVVAPDVVTITGTGTFASSAVGTGIVVTDVNLVLGGTHAANYSIAQPGDLAANITSGPTVLAAGDIAIIGYNTGGNPDNFAILVLKDLTPGTQFFVNDNELASATSTSFTDLSEAEASFTVKSGQTIPAGTVIVLPWGAAAVSTTTYDWSATTGAGLGNNNDEIYIYTASSITSTTPDAFIYFAKIGGSPSAVPSSLETTTTGSGTTAISPNGAALRYAATGNVYNSCKQILLNEIGKTANWTSTGATSLAANDWTFTVQPTCPTPTVATTGTVSALTAVYGTASSNGIFNVSGTNLTNNIVVTAPAGFQVSVNPTSGFAGTLTLTAVSGSVLSTPVYVRLLATDLVGNYTGTVSCTTNGGNTANVTVPLSTVTAKSVTITGIFINNKVEELGNFTATIAGTPVLNGILPTDNANVSLNAALATAVFAHDNSGTNIPVTVSGYALTGSAAANYSLTQPTGLVADITTVASPVITSALAFSSVYGTEIVSPYQITATSDPSFPVTVYNAANLPAGLNFDSATQSIIGTSTATPGNYTVTISATNAGGTTNAFLIYTIAKKEITVTATAENKVYNATDAAAITVNGVFGVVGSDDVAVTGGGLFDTKNIGTAKEVTAQLTLTGTQAANYSLVQPTGLSANITAFALTLSGAAAQNKVYDGNSIAVITATLVGVFSGDTVLFNGTGTFASAEVGNGISVTSTATLSGLNAANYSFIQPTGLTANITDPVLYANAFTGASACPTNGNIPTMAANATGTPLTRNSVTCMSTGNVFNSTTLNTTATASNTSYIEFAASASEGYQLNVKSLSFFRQASNSAPNQLEVRYSTDGFATFSTMQATPVSPTTGTVLTWDFPDFNTPTGGTVTFRLYPYGTQRADGAGTSSATGTFRVDDVIIYGMALTAPAEATISLAGEATVCAAGSSAVKVTVAGGASPYTVVYKNQTTNETFTVENYVSGSSIPVSSATLGNNVYSLVSVIDNNDSASALSGIVTVTVAANNTITLSSAAGTDSQTVCNGTPIIPITYATNGATGATFSGLPTGVSGSWSANVVTISGTPIAQGGSYTIALTGGCGTVSISGTITATSQLLWYLDADGDHYYTGAGVPSCTSPGIGYTMTVAGGNDCDDNNAAINPGAAEICYNNIDDNCNNIQSEGCAPVVVNMTSSYNGTTLSSFSTAVPAVGYTYPGTTNLKYRFSVTNTTTGVTAADVIQATRYVTIPLSIQAYNASYTIKASAVINDEVVPFAGNIITINAPTVQLVGLSSTSCGATLAALTTTIASNPGLNATGYTFRIRLNDSNPNPTYAYSQSSTRYVVANSFTGFPLQYSTSYRIAVQFTFNDPVTNQPVQSGYGAECVVNTPSIPVVGIASPGCGSQVAAMNTTMTATAASYATGYQFRIRLFGDNGSNPTYFTTAVLSSRFSALNAFQGITLAYSTEYSISVRYSILNGSTTVWSNYGPECKVITPFFPTTSLVPSQCGLEAATPMDRQLNITPYPGFPHYMVKIDELGNSEDPVATQEKEISYSYFKLSDFSLVQPEKRYNISVAIKLNGVFGDYSTACDINTIYGNTEGGEIVKTNANIFKAVASPNPFANNFMISLATTGKASVNVKVYDMIGRMIEQKDVKVSDMESTTIGNNYPSGVYNVVVSQGDNIETVRVVKR
ncbi:MAG: YDG domain-containing protein [Flavobacterium sp.]